ncbi:hypothetical protein R3P38DRAFT_3206527 [Favolaschia claudopus]|uniref:Uncharacterized protein n=1 Tax=Favolaschia claudopus TaxID=2862362 RepID=A0AAW0ANG7_9AGAR
MSVLLCEPIFSPDPGDEDPLTHKGGFYAVVSEKWKGIVTSPETLARTMKRFPDAHTFKAETYLRIMELWNQDCTEYHYHPDQPSPPPSPSPPALPSTQVTQRSVTSGKSRAESLTAKELLFLANNRPGAEPLSPRRAQQLFKRVLGYDSVVSLEDLESRMAAARIARTNARAVEEEEDEEIPDLLDPDDEVEEETQELNADFYPTETGGFYVDRNTRRHRIQHKGIDYVMPLKATMLIIFPQNKVVPSKGD